MPTNYSKRPPQDRIFGREIPLLFAHRGGAEEAPESTEEAFRHAVKHGADVLEVDVRLTHDGEIVVWHGPRLENVRGRKPGSTKRKKIGDYDWPDLRDNAWVVHPTKRPNFAAVRERRLMLLGDFFILVGQLQRELKIKRTLHLNIELKAHSGKGRHWDTEHINKLLDLVDEESKHRTIVLEGDRRRVHFLRHGAVLARARRLLGLQRAREGQRGNGNDRIGETTHDGAPWRDVLIPKEMPRPVRRFPTSCTRRCRGSSRAGSCTRTSLCRAHKATRR